MSHRAETVDCPLCERPATLMTENKVEQEDEYECTTDGQLVCPILRFVVVSPRGKELWREAK